MMGGLELGLRECRLLKRPAHLDVLSIMGGVQVVVPRDWHVRIEIAPVMAGYALREHPRSRPADRPIWCCRGD